MAYIPTIWVNGVAPAINATNLNKIEAGISNALPIDGSVAMIGGLTLSGNPTLALHATTKQYVDAISYIDAGAGLTKSGSTINIGQGTGIAVGTDAISLATLGTASASATFAKVNIDAYGRVSSYTPVVAGDITALVSINNPNVGVLVSGNGLSGGGTFSLNQSSQQTITITSNATSANTASTIVARDVSGNFSAGTITAALSGNASTATTATNIAAGSAGAIPYQTSASNTSFLSIGTANQVLGVNNGGTGYDYKTLSGSNVTVTNSAGSIAIGIPQSVATGATPTFAQLSISNAPSADSHAATKAYVDSIAQGLRIKQSVKVATTGNLATSASGATVLTLSSPLTTVDGVGVTTNDRILVKDQTGATMNGIYVYTNSTTLTRSSDADSSPTGDVVAGIFTFVEQGTSYADTGWVLTTDNPITIGTTGLTFAQFSGAGQVIAGTGLSKSGNTISIANTAVTTGTYKSVTVNQQGQVTSGTNPTNLSGYGITDAIDTSASSQTKSGSLSLGSALNSAILRNRGFTLLDMNFGSHPEVSASVLNPIAFALANGKPLNADNDFAAGTNNINIYDNSATGQVTYSRTLFSGVPNNSGYVLQFTHTGVSTTPGLGGFYQQFVPERNKTYIQIFKAKIPTGYALSVHSNAIGNNSSDYWMTGSNGTGEWETYLRVVQAGNTGTFNTCGFVALNIDGGAAPSVVSPLVWQLASCNVYDISSFIDSLKITGGNITGALNVSGNVGIGTISPADKLHVEGNIYLGTANRTIYTAGSGNLVLQTNTGTMIFTRNGAANESMRISAGGSVGIGTLSPTSLLHLSGIGSTAGSLIGSIIRINDSAGTSIATTFGGIGFESPNNGPDFVIGKITENTSSALGFKSGTGTELMRLTSSGYLGIGVNPNVELHAKGSGEIFRIETTSATGDNFIRFYAPSATTQGYFGYVSAASNNMSIQNVLNSDLLLHTNNTERVRITAAGNVGIGSTNATSLLEVKGQIASFSPMFRIVNTGVSSGYQSVMGFYTNNSTSTPFLIGKNNSNDSSGSVFISNQANTPMYFETNATTRMTLTSGGNLGIGTTAPTPNANRQTLTINGAQGGVLELATAGVLGYQLYPSSSTNPEIINYNITNGAGVHLFSINGNERMRLTAGGNLGVGTTGANGKFSVKTSTSDASFEVDTTTTHISLLSYDRNIGAFKNMQLRGTDIIFMPSDVERMRFTNAGNLGIGTTTPSGDGTSLHIHGTTYATLHLTNNTSGLTVNDGADLVVDGNNFIVRNRETTGSILFRTNNGGSEIVMDQNGGLKIGDPILKANTNSIVFNNAAVMGSGINNVAIGEDSFRDGSFGNDNNVIIGYQAAYKSSGAQLSNVAIGAGAMYDTQGGGCVAIGVSTLAGQGAATAFYSTVVGAFAGQSIIGDYNVGVGGLSLRKGDGGASYNATIGYESIPNLTSGGRNSVLGAQAGYSLTSGLNNVFIGYNSGRDITTGSNNVVIGSLAGVTNLSDTVLIGTGTTERMRISSAGNVGIGATNPSALLDLYSSAARIKFNRGNSYNLSFGIHDSSTSGLSIKDFNDANTLVYFDYTGNVGIGTTSLNQTNYGGRALSISASNDSVVEIISTSANTDSKTIGALQFVNSGSGITGKAAASIFGLQSGTDATNPGAILGFATRLNGGSSMTERMRIASSGNVGINTTNPTAQLEVIGGISLSGTLRFNNSAGASGQVLTSQGGSAPIWTTISGGGGTGSYLPLSGGTLSGSLEVNGGGSFSGEVRVEWFDIGTGAQSTDNIRIGNGMALSTGGGFGNVSIGKDAMLSHTSAGSNVGIGQSSLRNTTSGGANTSIGTGAMLSNISGTNNVALGRSALAGSTNTSSNIAIGYNALAGNTNSKSNLVAVGASALAANTTGELNTAIGHLALQNNTIGYDNTALGYRALAGASEAIFSIAIGASALSGSTNNTAAYCVAIGNNSLALNTSGQHNTVVGYRGMYSNTSGVYNTALGSYTLNSNTSGNDNVAAGYFALGANTTGWRNTGFGSSALGSNTTGYNNVGIGHLALNTNTGGSYSTALGAESLLNSTGSRNIAIGYQAGINVTTGASNTIIGSLAGFTNMSNTMLFGAGTVERFRVDSGGDMLLGYTTSNGAYKLQVNGQIFATSSTIATSDQNYKENISTIQDGLTIIKSLNPVQFNWKEHPIHSFDTTTPTVGFIAQEVKQSLIDEAYLNSIVKESKAIYEKDGEIVEEVFLGIAESNLIAILTKAVQQLSQKVEDLEAKLANK